MRALTTAWILLAAASPLTAQAEYSSLFGKDGDDWILAVQTDVHGRIYVCGQTDAQIHVTAGAFQPTPGGGADAFVACIDPRQPAGGQLVWSTHLGGSGDEAAYDLHVGDDGRTVTVVGATASTDFPLRSARQSQLGGGYDAFVAVLTPAASGAGQLSWSTYLGGVGDDFATSVAVHGGRVTVAGGTESVDFPVRAAWQPRNGGLRDLFVSQWTDTGGLSWSTYLGGAGQEGELPDTGNLTGRVVLVRMLSRSVHVAADQQGRITVASYTASPDFPNPSGTVHGPRGGWDLCVTRFDPAGRSMLDSGIVGGSWHDYVADMALDGADGVLMAVTTRSPDFPQVSGTGGGNWFPLAVHLDFAQGNLASVTRLGNGPSLALTIHGEAAGTMVVGGVTVNGAVQGTRGAPMTSATARFQPFLGRIAPASTPAISYLTLWGGSGQSFVHSIVPDHRGGVVAVGGTWAPDHPTTPDAFDSAATGGAEGWLVVHEMLPAVVSRYGRSSASCGGSVYLQMDRAPLPPFFTPLNVETHGAPPSAVGVMVLGAPLPAGQSLLGADIFVATPYTLLATVTADASGFARHPLQLPGSYVWNGALGLQSVWISPAGCGGAALTASNALR